MASAKISEDCILSGVEVRHIDDSIVSILDSAYLIFYLSASFSIDVNIGPVLLYICMLSYLEV